MLRIKLTVVFLCFTTAIHAEDPPVYGELGGAVVLVPEPFTELTSIVWKHGKDKAVEWEGGQPDAYRLFKGRTKLNQQNGHLTINNLIKELDGVYSAEVNGKQSSKTSRLIVLSSVSKPTVTFHCSESECVLSCSGEPADEGRYAWSDAEGNRLESAANLTVNKIDATGKAYICSYSNPVSSASSDPVAPAPDAGSYKQAGFIAAVVIGVAASIALSAIVFVYRHTIMDSVRKILNGNRTDTTPPGETAKYTSVPPDAANKEEPSRTQSPEAVESAGSPS